MKKLKLIASYVRLITCLLLHRNFGNILKFFEIFITFRKNFFELLIFHAFPVLTLAV